MRDQPQVVASPIQCIYIYIQYTITYNNNNIYIYIHIILSDLRAHHFEADLGIDLTHPSQTVVQSSQYRV